MTGQMTISNNFVDVTEAIAGGITVVALVDDADKYRYINCVIMGNLLPPYEALSAEIDGDQQQAANIYYSYLMSKIGVIANILAALNMGKNILIFVPEEESMNFGFVNVLLGFFVNVFGISIGTEQSPYFIIDQPLFAARRADALFVNGLIPFENYCMLMPLGAPPSVEACGKIVQSITYRFDSMDRCVSYCTQYIASVKQQAKGTITPVFRVTT